MSALEAFAALVTILTLLAAVVRHVWKQRRMINTLANSATAWIERHIALCFLLCMFAELVTACEVLILVAKLSLR